MPNSIEIIKARSETITSNGKGSSNLGYISGQILFTPMDSGITYLIDSTGAINHTWSSIYLPGVGVRWLGNGTILRTIRVGIGPGTGGAGGGVQKVEWDGTVVWDYRYNTNGHLSHHDVKPLPNGNVLLIAWETKTRDEAIAAGRNPNYAYSNIFMPDHIIEVQPTGPKSGTIVWEWHVWDHLIQDYDSSKPNYGVVGDHPELVDFNYGTYYSGDLLGFDWLHTNSIDYNEKFDQILISARNFNEIWVIDHSTTTAEAAGHTGGNSGKGGDLLYRWGNPAAYRAGSTDNQKFFSQHDASWVDEKCPGAGNILVFNNGVDRPNGMYSSVDEIAPPVNEKGEYYRASDSAYGPTTQTWIYTADPPTSFYDHTLSGAVRLRNGNILVCNGHLGRFFEMTPTGEIVWEYWDPSILQGYIFKCDYIPSEQETQNNPPNTPIKPNGRTNGDINTEYTYTSRTFDPDEDQIYYLWDWGDGNMSDWLGPYGSGVTAGVTHNWTIKGSYNIKVKAKDIYGKESTWSDPLLVTMPYTYRPLWQFFDSLFARFPNAFPILRHVFGY